MSGGGGLSSGIHWHSPDQAWLPHTGSQEGPRGPHDLADDLGLQRTGTGLSELRVRMVADELPHAGAILPGPLDDEALRRADDVEPADPPPPTRLIDENGAAVDERRLHRLPPRI